MKLLYPACFYLEDDGGYSVDIPDLLGCVTQGDNLTNAVEMAIDAASGWILNSLQDGEPIPPPSRMEDIKPEYENNILKYITLDIDDYSEKLGKELSTSNLLFA